MNADSYLGLHKNRRDAFHFVFFDPDSIFHVVKAHASHGTCGHMIHTLWWGGPEGEGLEYDRSRPESNTSKRGIAWNLYRKTVIVQHGLAYIYKGAVILSLRRYSGIETNFLSTQNFSGGESPEHVIIEGLTGLMTEIGYPLYFRRQHLAQPPWT